MNEIKCPKCGEVFQVDESGYAQILQQVRDSEFKKELERRMEELEHRKEELEQSRENDLKIARMEQEKSYIEDLAKKEKTFTEDLAKNKLELAERDREIERLKAEIKNGETEKRLAVSEAVQQKDREIVKYQGEVELRDGEIQRLKDFKARQSTKMVGESLEQHCMNEFNAIRMTAFPHAYFERDNDINDGTKGDFVFRDFDDDVEYISIMFEMKNEMDTTATKHKNEDFFKKLDSDRNKKNCEYAVLVSLLEEDSELYNKGIVDVSYQYPKMYVVRPQFFIPLITLLRNAAQNALEYQHELLVVKNQQVDIQNFEDNMQKFKEGFGRNYRLASQKFTTAIDEIDKTISHLQKTKEALLSSENNLRIANEKAEDLSIKKLTRNAPSVAEMFDKKDSGKNRE